ncbi:MAG: hypothetical protein ABI626_05945 [Sphingomicrobium sp.]
MFGYRLYFMNGSHIVHSREFTAEDDLAAIDIAGSWRETRPMELWRQDHRIQQWDATKVIPVEAPA